MAGISLAAHWLVVSCTSSSPQYDVVYQVFLVIDLVHHGFPIHHLELQLLSDHILLPTCIICTISSFQGILYSIPLVDKQVKEKVVHVVKEVGVNFLVVFFKLSPSVPN